MTAILTIDGMHCQACVSLVSLELDDIGLLGRSAVKLLDTGKCGTVTILDVSAQDIERVTSLVNSLESYSVADVEIHD